VRARLTRLLRREYWPSWTLYAPLAPWFALLALRYGGVRTVAAANPAIPGGGFVGESKGDILSLLPEEWTLQGFVIDAGEPAWRLALAEQQIGSRGWAYPVIYKPDTGQRGVGVRLIHSREQAEKYLTAETGPVLVQVYHPGPFEAGIFYYRMPNEPRGRIFSITDKHFPFVVGDGRATLEELIWRHARLHAQAGVFLARLGAGAARIPTKGEHVSLAIAGNHAQGTMFLDGSALWSEALERRVDEIARAAGGLFIGRFDVRYSDVGRFRRGEDLSIVEFNGVTAEPTDIYDPSRALVSACVTLARQWLLTFRIGAANRARGIETLGVKALAREVAMHLRSRPPHPVSD
jgi:hypothetical protein